MKKHILTISCLMIVAVLAAQKPAKLPEPTDSKDDFSLFSKDTWLGRFQKQQNKIVSKLGLNEVQRRSLDTMNDTYVTQRSALFDDKNLERKDRKAEIGQLQNARSTKFQSILTPEQLKKWEEFRRGQKKKVFRKK